MPENREKLIANLAAQLHEQFPGRFPDTPAVETWMKRLENSKPSTRGGARFADTCPPAFARFLVELVDRGISIGTIEKLAREHKVVISARTLKDVVKAYRAKLEPPDKILGTPAEEGFDRQVEKRAARNGSAVCR